MRKDSYPMDGHADLGILDKIRTPLLESNERGDQELGNWLRSNYPNKGPQPARSTLPIKNCGNFRRIDEAFKRVRLLTGRAQDEWPITSPIFRQSAAAMRRFVDEEGKASISSSSVKPAGKVAATESRLSDSVAKDTTTAQIPKNTPIPSSTSGQSDRGSSQSCATVESLESDAIEQCKSSNTLLPKQPHDSNGTSNVIREHPELAVCAKPITTNLDRLPPGCKNNNKRKRDLGNNSSGEGANSDPSSKCQKLNKIPAASEAEASTTTTTRQPVNQGKKGGQARTGVATTETRITRAAAKKVKAKEVKAEEDTQAGKESQLAAHTTQIQKTEPAQAEVEDMQMENEEDVHDVIQNSGTQYVQMNNVESTQPLDGTRVVHGEDVPASLPTPTPINSDHEEATTADEELSEEYLNIISSKEPQTPSVGDSAVFGLATNSHASSTRESQDIDNMLPNSTEESISAGAAAPSLEVMGDKPATVRFFARVETAHGPVDVPFSQDKLADAQLLSNCLQEYADWKQISNSDISFDEWHLVRTMV